MNQQNDSQNSPLNGDDNEKLNTMEEIKTDEVAENSESSKPQKKKSKLKKILLWILIILLVLILSGVLTVFILIEKGKSSLLNVESMKIDPSGSVSEIEVEDDGKTVEFEGKKYIYNEDMTAILCIGVDKEEFSDAPDVKGNNGQADALFLCAMDTKTGKTTLIPISRDSMVDVDIYSGDGNYISSSKKQLCLSYAYGDGKHTSCENTVRSVSRLFYGLPINSYVAIDLKAIEVLSEKVSGVTVIPDENFSYLGYNYYKGVKTTLKGKKARIFVQGRDQSKLDSNLNRMARQKQFVTAFFNKAIEKTKKKITFPVDVYNSTNEYIITDLDVAEISFLASCVIKNNIGLQYKTIEGSVVKGDEHAEYYVDDNSVYNAIIEVFYKPVS
ncbi:MAG: LCP family protein [Clostridia bacterium]|nr:LCP family protein [Clostridia bacterium]